MILRLRSRDGLERVTVADNATVGVLKQAIAMALNVPVEEQILSTNHELLLSAYPGMFQDMVTNHMPLAALGVGHGSVIFWRYQQQRSVAGPRIEVTPAGIYGRKMTVEDMVAKQTRIERQEKPMASSVSFDQEAANVFQQYVNESLAFSIKRGGFMYGFLGAEGEIMVDFIYEPPQQGTVDNLQLLRDREEESRVNALATALGMRKVGFILAQSSTEERDFTLSSAEVCQIAKLQAESEFEEFVFVIVKLLEDESGPNVHFEAFELSKQCIKLFKEDWFLEGGDAPGGVSKMKQELIVAGKDVTEVDNDFFLVPVKIVDHVGTLKTIFGVENRIPPPSEEHLRDHLKKTRGLPFHDRLADFHLLLFLSQFLDLENDMAQLAEAVRLKMHVPEGYQVLIESL